MLLLQTEIYQNIYYNNMNAFIISFYIIGVILGLLIYDIIIYEKYNNRLFKDFSKKDILNSTFVLFSWFYLINLIFKITNINFIIMETIKKIGKKIWNAYVEGVEMQYRYIIYK